MAYAITKSDSTVLGIVPDNTEFIPGTPLIPADSSPTGTGAVLDLTMYGRGRLAWGERVNENFVHLLENFADSAPPPFPLPGQTWFEVTGTPTCGSPISGAFGQLNFFDGCEWIRIISSGGSGGAGVTINDDVTINGDTQFNGTSTITDANADCDSPSLIVENTPSAAGGPVVYIKSNDSSGEPAILLRNPDNGSREYVTIASRDSTILTVEYGSTETTCSAGTTTVFEIATDGKIQSVSTADSDPDTTLVTKDFLTSVANTAMPAGSVMAFAGSSTPSGFVECDGTAYSTGGTYAALFASIGTTYGTAGAGTFRVPDLRGRVIAMENGGTFAALGTVAGSENAVVVTHNHTGSSGSAAGDGTHGHSSTSGGSHGHSSTFANPGHVHSGTTGTPSHQDVEGGVPPLPGAADQHTHSFTTGGPSGSSSVGSGGSTHSHTVSSAGSTHSHSVSVNVASDGVSGLTKNIQPTLTLKYIISLGF